MKEKPYYGNDFWAREYCVDTVGLKTEMIRKYIKYQEAKERKSKTPKYYRETWGSLSLPPQEAKQFVPFQN